MGYDSEEDLSESEIELYEDDDDFRNELLECINSIKAAGSFATGGVIDSFPNPGIRVDGELITLPLSPQEAQKLAGQSSKAPFGKNRETLIDETVRKTLEIEADRIAFQNPKWSNFVNELVKRVAHELGVPPGNSGCNVRAELYKNLLYEPGAMFKPHKDTEKAPGMFGTLVICLPSEHTGGTVRLQHGEETTRLSTAESSAFDCSYLAWYADVRHEIETIQSGYRWVLTYNLMHDFDNSRPSALALDSQTERLAQTLSHWHSLKSPPPYLVHHLAHQYTQKDLSLQSLKGHDYYSARCLADSCDTRGKFYPFLAQLEMFTSWSGDDDGMGYGSRHPRRRILFNMNSFDGVSISPLELEIPRELLLQRIHYSDRKPHSRDGGDYMGNQSADIEETYLDTVIVIVPEKYLHEPLFGPGNLSNNVSAVMKHLRNAISNKTIALPREILGRLCRTILAATLAVKEQNDVFFGLVAASAASLGDRQLLQTALDRTQKSWPAVCWSDFGALIDLQNPLVDQDTINSGLLKCGTFQGIHQNLTNFYRGFYTANSDRKVKVKAEYWKQWYSDKLVEILERRFESGEEGISSTIRKIVLDVHDVQHTPEQRDIIYKKVADFVQGHSKDKAIVNSLVVELLFPLSRPYNGPLLFFHPLLHIVLEPAISNFDLNLCSAYLGSKYVEDNAAIPPPGSRNSNTGRFIRIFYDWALAYSEDAASRLLYKFAVQALGMEKEKEDTVLLPSIKELITSVDTGSLEVQYCFQLLVRAYIAKSVGPEPQKPENWARPEDAKKCWREGCRKCAEVANFLEDSTAKELTVDLGPDDSHVKYQFCQWNGSLESKTMDEKGGRLRFTKTLNGWEHRHKNWKREFERVKQDLRSLPKNELERLLADQYDKLMALDLGSADGSITEQSDGGHLAGKRLRDEDVNDAELVLAAKRARLDEEETED